MEIQIAPQRCSFIFADLSEVIIIVLLIFYSATWEAKFQKALTCPTGNKKKKMTKMKLIKNEENFKTFAGTFARCINLSLKGRGKMRIRLFGHVFSN